MDRRVLLEHLEALARDAKRRERQARREAMRTRILIGQIVDGFGNDEGVAQKDEHGPERGTGTEGYGA